ncbi:MAG: aspartate/glutamate racemase family protein [Opitutaceae bacterium]|nr:aspartate/glutamate racemase family protein [Opitutaceae bacterium]
MRTLAMLHTVHWYKQSVIEPFAEAWLAANPDIHAINIMDDSLLAESLEHGGPTAAVIARMGLYVAAAVRCGADVIMSSCTTMGVAIEQAQKSCPVPLFNIDEPMAREAVRLGRRLGILATVPTSAPATRRLLQREALAAGKSIEIETVINEPAFSALLAGNRAEHDRLVHAEMNRLASQVDVIVLGQISLAQIQHRPGVPVLQVGHSGFAYARQLLNEVPARKPAPVRQGAAAC